MMDLGYMSFDALFDFACDEAIASDAFAQAGDYDGAQAMLETAKQANALAKLALAELSA